MLEYCNTRQELMQAWGNWLTDIGNRIGGWDWYATLTFRDPADPRRPGWTKPGWAYTGKGYDKFMSYLGDVKGLHDLRWVRGRELQHWRGVSHFHALIGGVSNLRRDEAWAWWFERYGLARILPYDVTLGAGYYLCKYVTKELGEIEFSTTITGDLTRSHNSVTV